MHVCMRASFLTVVLCLVPPSIPHCCFSRRRTTNDPEKDRPLSMDGGHTDAVLGLLSLVGETATKSVLLVYACYIKHTRTRSSTFSAIAHGLTYENKSSQNHRMQALGRVDGLQTCRYIACFVRPLSGPQAMSGNRFSLSLG